MVEAGGSDAMTEGRIVRVDSGFYDVALRGRVVRARARGRLRRDADDLLTGDRVEVALLDDGTAVIQRLLPRRNRLVRPAAANVDQVVIVFSLAQPEWNRALTDRIAVLAEADGIDVVFCLNKTDLVEPRAAEAAAEPYRRAGYPVVPVAAKFGVGVDALVERLSGRVTVLAGESGVGKSTLLNVLQPDLRLQTGDVSPRLRRGRHTTRHAQLLGIRRGGRVIGYVVDTPGFNRLDVTAIDRLELSWCFPEFRGPSEQCRFDDCLHRAEPGCAVKEAVERGRIDPARYENYLKLLDEIEQQAHRF
ncbi:MAG TPA: ribosome small subunit-dependent GTPase A [Bacillota bacterium]